MTRPVCPDLVLEIALAQRLAGGGGAPILPDNGGMDRRAGGAVPEDGRLPLVGDANGVDGGRADAGIGQGRGDDREAGRPDRVRVMLDPAGLGVVLPDLG